MTPFNRPQHLIRLGNVLFLALLLASCGDRFKEAGENATLANSQLTAGNLEAARRSVQRAIVARDDVGDYFILLARIELQAGEPVRAFNAYSRALDLKADNLEVLQGIAQLGLQTGRDLEAREAADRILLLFPQSTNALLVKGFLAIDDGRFEEAEEFAAAIRAIDPDDQGGAILLARVQAINGNFSGATETMNAAKMVHGDSDALSATLLEIFRAEGNEEGLAKAFPEVIARTGNNADYRIDYVNFLYKTENMSTARAQVRTIFEDFPEDSRTLSSVKDVLHEYDRTPFTDEELAQFASDASIQTQLTLARFYLEIGDYDRSGLLLRQGLEIGMVEAQGIAARLYVADGRTDAAVEMIAKAIESDPENTDALLAKADHSLSLGRADDALAYANKVVSEAPQEYEGYTLLAAAQLAKGRELRATQILEQGIDFLPQNVLLAIRYEDFLRRTGNEERILSLYRDLASAKPSSVSAWREFSRACKEFENRTCERQLEAGLQFAERSFVIDDPPGSPGKRGLFSRITPEQICRAAGGVCTSS